MYRIDRIKKTITNVLYDHPRLKIVAEFVFATIITLISSFLFSLGFNSFINPNFTAIAASGISLDGVAIKQLASCGSSGIVQSIIMILKFFNIEWLTNDVKFNILYWILYFVVNLPVLIFAFIKIGKRFSTFTLINVGFATVFGIVLKSDDPSFFVNQISAIFYNQPLTRVLLAGLFTGVSSGLAYLIESSTGAFDIISYYIGEIKSKLVGKFSRLINCCVMIVFSVLSLFPQAEIFNNPGVPFATALAVFLLTFIYMQVATFVIDIINTQNKKYQAQIITTKPNLAINLIAALPHSCTIINGKGGYTNNDKGVILIAVRKKELPKLLSICRELDPEAFIDVIPLENVYGKFYRKRIR